jgi:hypothetical protein
VHAEELCQHALGRILERDNRGERIAQAASALNRKVMSASQKLTSRRIETPVESTIKYKASVPYPPRHTQAVLWPQFPRPMDDSPHNVDARSWTNGSLAGGKQHFESMPSRRSGLAGMSEGRKNIAAPMTINIAIAVSEGLVMAADSMTQINAPNHLPIKSYPTAEKLSEIGGLPIAVMTSGVGAISRRSVMSLIRAFEFFELPKLLTASEAQGPIQRPSVEQVADALRDFLEPKYREADWGAGPAPQIPGVAPQWPPLLCVVVGGFSTGQFFPDVFEIVFDHRGATKARKHPVSGAPEGSPSISWWGVGASLNRLLHGFDLNELTAGYILLTQHPQVYQAMNFPPVDPPANFPMPNECLGPLAPFARMKVVLDYMPLQEAVEFADYLGKVAIGYSRFSAGMQIVGGKLDVLAIQPEGLSWYRRKKFVASMAAARGRTTK